MNAKKAKQLRAEALEACRLDSRISFNKLWKKIVVAYNATPAKQRKDFTIFEKHSHREVKPIQPKTSVDKKNIVSKSTFELLSEAA